MARIVSQVLRHGTAREASDLVDALSHYCSCKVSLTGGLRVPCAPHRMLLDDQRALNGLLVARRMVERLRLEEFAPDAANTPGVTNQ